MTQFELTQKSFGHGQLGDRTLTLLREAGIEVKVYYGYPESPDEYYVECRTADDITTIAGIVDDPIMVSGKSDGDRPVLTIMNGYRDEKFLKEFVCPYCGDILSQIHDVSRDIDYTDLDVDETFIDLEGGSVKLGCSTDCRGCDEQVMVTIDCTIKEVKVQTFDDWSDDQ